MLFSSITFLYYFLPILLLVYFVVPNKYKNRVLLLFSLIFYFYGEPRYIWVLLLSCFINFYAGKWIGKNRTTKKATFILIASILMNVGLLFYFKYTNFMFQNINQLFDTHIPILSIVMPIGISFFTFQTLSYVIDVYQNKVSYNKSLLDFATYVTLFPQLVAGPIVRYQTVEKELRKRKHSYDLFAKGIGRFTIGLAKKILIANILGEMVSQLNDISVQTVLSSWMQAIGYSLQIYFDFSGYSDMAIGLGLMFGFHFLENFNYPFIASSITDFWRRWHISLSSWLRDYVYIPLGGNRVSKVKWIRNILIVWFLTGFWHGAAWNFIVWGLYFALLLLIEKIFLHSFLKKHKIFSHFYTLLFVIISFVIFSGEDIQSILVQLKNMFGFGNLRLMNFETLYYLKSYAVLLFIASIASTPIIIKLIRYLKSKKKWIWIEWLEPIYYIVLLLICTAFLIDASFNPFLYFRF